MAVLALCTIALVAGVLAGCGARPSAGNAEVQATVRRYNELLAEGFRRLDMNALAPVATRDQEYTEYLQMAALGEGDRKLDSKLVSLAFLSVKGADTPTATVTTHELWAYRQVSIETSKVYESAPSVEYDLTYELVKRNDRWLVNWVTDTKNPQLPPERRGKKP